MPEVSNPKLLALFLALIILPMLVSAFFFLRSAMRRGGFIDSINRVDQVYPASPKYSKFMSISEKVLKMQTELKYTIQDLRDSVDKMDNDEIKKELLPKIERIQSIAGTNVIAFPVK